MVSFCFACSESLPWKGVLFIAFFLLDVDFDFDIDPPPTADETAFPAPGAQVAPEVNVDQEAAAPAPAVIVLPAPPAPPATSGVQSVEKNSAAAALAQVEVSPTSISVDASIEDSVVEGFKETLAKASGIELRLRELVSDAGMMKNQMHVSTYVSLLSMLQLLHPRAVLIDFQGEYFLVHPVGVGDVRAGHSSDEIFC